MRLREFESLMEMLKQESGANLFTQMVTIQEKYQELEKVFRQIDCLEAMVAKVKVDLEKVEKELVKAEATITQPKPKIVPSLLVCNFLRPKSVA